MAKCFFSIYLKSNLFSSLCIKVSLFFIYLFFFGGGGLSFPVACLFFPPSVPISFFLLFYVHAYVCLCVHAVYYKWGFTSGKEEKANTKLPIKL